MNSLFWSISNVYAYALYTYILYLYIGSDKASNLMHFMAPAWSSAYRNLCVVKEACILLNSKLA